MSASSARRSLIARSSSPASGSTAVTILARAATLPSHGERTGVAGEQLERPVETPSPAGAAARFPEDPAVVFRLQPSNVTAIRGRSRRRSALDREKCSERLSREALFAGVERSQAGMKRDAPRGVPEHDGCVGLGSSRVVWNKHRWHKPRSAVRVRCCGSSGNLSEGVPSNPCAPTTCPPRRSPVPSNEPNPSRVSVEPCGDGQGVRRSCA